MKNSFLTIKVEPELRARVKTIAEKERRSIADQTAYLMELGIKALEGQTGPDASLFNGTGAAPGPTA
jgi:predicted transcriptional regulator